MMEGKGEEEGRWGLCYKCLLISNDLLPPFPSSSILSLSIPPSPIFLFFLFSLFFFFHASLSSFNSSSIFSGKAMAWEWTQWSTWEEGRKVQQSVGDADDKKGICGKLGCRGWSWRWPIRSGKKRASTVREDRVAWSTEGGTAKVNQGVLSLIVVRRGQLRNRLQQVVKCGGQVKARWGQL